MKWQTLKLELQGHQQSIARLSFNRPKKLNAFNQTMCQEMLAALKWLQRQTPTPRVLILQGSGRAFSSGADLAENPANFKSPEQSLIEDFHPILTTLYELPFPIISAINGPCVGISVGIGLLGDIILMQETAYLWLTFSKIGLSPDGGSSYFLPRLVGRQTALAMMLLPEKITAQRALALNLVYQIYPEALFESAVNQMAEELACGPTISYQKTRNLLRHSFDNTYAQQLQLEAKSQNECAQSKDVAEGIQAFIQKRNPKFSGQ